MRKLLLIFLLAPVFVNAQIKGIADIKLGKTIIDLKTTLGLNKIDTLRSIYLQDDVEPLQERLDNRFFKSIMSNGLALVYIDTKKFNNDIVGHNWSDACQYCMIDNLSYNVKDNKDLKIYSLRNYSIGAISFKDIMIICKNDSIEMIDFPGEVGQLDTLVSLLIKKYPPNQSQRDTKKIVCKIVITGVDKDVYGFDYRTLWSEGGYLSEYIKSNNFDLDCKMTDIVSYLHVSTSAFDKYLSSYLIDHQKKLERENSKENQRLIDKL